MQYLPWSDTVSYANALNDAGVIAGAAGSDVGVMPFRYDPATDTGPVTQPTAGIGWRVNSNGTEAGGAYYPGGIGAQMYRIDTGAAEAFPILSPGIAAGGLGIDSDGTTVGLELLPPAPPGWGYGEEAIRYSDSRGLENLNDLLDTSWGWTLYTAEWIGGGSIVGRGLHDGLNRSYVLTTTPSGDIASITDLGISPDYATDDPSCVWATKGNSSGVIVAGVYTTNCGTPLAATVYAPGTGMINLNSLIDPQSGWDLLLATGINDKNEVVGYGNYTDPVHGIQLRGFKMTLPDLSPCPAPADSCHLQGQRNFLTGVCSNPPVTDGSGCGGITVSVLGVAKEGSTWKAVFAYQSTSPTEVDIPYGPDNDLIGDNNQPITSPQQYPPTAFVSTTHAPFVATISGSQLTWTVGTSSAIASTTSSQHLTVTTLPDGTNQAQLPGGGLVNLDSTPPASPPGVQPPNVGPEFNGVLTGQFAVSPSGAATYTVPISIPPGVAGMAPNLSLAYSSQAADGIAGQGWSLGGLSMITRCPRTRQQDGYGRPVMMDALTNGPSNQDGKTDGICLDGQKLFDTLPGNTFPSGTATCVGSSSVVMCYTPEKQDFSTITLNSTGEFQVVTKAGETRYYGLQTYDRVNDSGGNTGVWLLDRVVDGWGNYFDFHYNNCSDSSCDPAFTSTGIWVSRISYTGSLGGAQGGAIDPSQVNNITFGYECRPDIRWTRFASLKIPQNQRLTSINTPQGAYTLTYATPAPEAFAPGGCNSSQPAIGLSELQSIGYCAGATCTQQLKPLTFGWQGGQGGSWQRDPGYNLLLATGKGLRGTQFVDIDGDGRADLIYARATETSNSGAVQRLTYLNVGDGWGDPLDGPNQTFPVDLSDNNDNPTGARFADLNGDGRPDIIVDSANVMCTAAGCVSCPYGKPCSGQATQYSPAVWLNTFAPGAKSGGWEFHGEFGIMPQSQNGDSITQPGAINFETEFPATVADVNGDGLADLVLVQETVRSCAEIDVLLNHGPSSVGQNQGTGQATPWSLQMISSSPGTYQCDPVSFPRLYTGPDQVQMQLQDVNRDGLPDLVTLGFDPTGVYTGSPYVLINTSSGDSLSFGPPAASPYSPQTPVPGFYQAPSYADVDGDGFYDFVGFYSSAFGVGTVPNNGALATMGMGNGIGWGFVDNSTGPYLQVLNAFAPSVQKVTDPHQTLPQIPVSGVPSSMQNTDDEDFAFSLADINGDGLVDLIRYHENVGPAVTSGQGGIEILYNTGTTWLDPDGITAWQAAIGPSGIHAVAPSAVSDIANIGSAFVDLDGDGFADLIQEEAGDQGFNPGAWINPNQAPRISTFPNGLAAPTTANYVNITSKEGAATYKDDDKTAPFTKLLTVPLLVVANTTAADGTGTGSLDTQTFTYHSLRQDTNGRGPLGFDRIEIQDQVSNTLTSTRYEQVYPFTGLPAQVDKYQLTSNPSHQYLISDTATMYCYGTVPDQCGDTFAHGQQPTGPLFVFPGMIVDTAYLHPEANDALNLPLGDTADVGDPTDAIVTTSQFQYYDFGSPETTTTTTAKTEHCVVDNTTKPCATETFSKTDTNTYATSAEQQQGKPDTTVVTSTGGTKSATHTTSFEYATADTFGGSSSTVLALTKTHVEPGADWPIRLDTAYAYDRFGNLVTTTSCASDFGGCNATSPPTLNPYGPSDPVHHPPYRTTSVTYDPSGRFPVLTTDPAGHSVTTLYDPILGALLTKTDPNGIETCYGYDALGRQVKKTDRCGSSDPLITTTDRRLATTDPAVQCCTAQVVTVVTPPTGNPVWTFTDDQGHVVETLTGGFDGSLIETRSVHDALGRVSQQSKPFVSTDQPFFTVTVPDSVFTNRVSTVTDPLGVIDSSNVLKSTTITTTYNGTTIQTERTVDRPNGTGPSSVTETELETKNAIGKVESESRVTETGTVTTSYQYDADGNTTVTTDPFGNQILVVYDMRGRKQTMTDPDMGTWHYTQDGFGDLVVQIDPNALQSDPNTTGTTMSYDPLGRILTKTTPTEGMAQWVYDVGAGAVIGQLAAMVGTADPNFVGDCTIPSAFSGLSGANRAVKVFSYDQFGQMAQVDECADGANFTTTYQYDPLGRQSEIRYPAVGNSQLAVGYHYTSLGYLQYLTDDSSDYSVLWQALAVNALGQVKDEQMRNGVETVSTRNPLTGWPLNTTATAHGNNNVQIQNWSYEFDELGDLLTRTRTDAVNPLTSQETFTYDLTNRVLTASGQTEGGTTASSWLNSYAYDAIGNLSQKDGQTYNYGTSAGCAAGPHAVCSVGGGTLYVYDANGNMTSTGSRTVTYNGSNKATTIASDPATSLGNDTGIVNLIYGADGNRVVQSLTSDSTTIRTIYVGLGGTGKSLFEQTSKTVGATTTVENLNYIYAGGVHGGNAFAVRVLDQGGSPTATNYYSFDHLGSVTAVSDEEGRISTSGSDATVLAYDVWGARRNPDESAAMWQSFTPPVGNREFTGQEQIPDTGLVNMNGRVYDPTLGRFLSPDPNVQDPSDTQSYNRYSYVLNNPLRYTDPTGYVSWGGAWSDVKSTVENPMFWAEAAYETFACVAGGPFGCLVGGIQLAMFNGMVALGNGAPFLQTVLEVQIGIGVSVLGYEFPMFGLVEGSASAAAETAIDNRLTTGRWGGNDILAAAFISAAEGAAMTGVQTVQVLSAAQEMAEEQASGIAANDSQSGTSVMMARRGSLLAGLGPLIACPGSCASPLIFDPPPGPGPLGIPLLRDPIAGPYGVADYIHVWSVDKPIGWEAIHIVAGIAVPIEGAIAAETTTVGEYTLTGTLARESQEYLAGGPYFGRLVRPFQSSPLTIQEIMEARLPVPDPDEVPGAVRWDVPGTFRGTPGTYGLVLQLETNTILHFNFERLP